MMSARPVFFLPSRTTLIILIAGLLIFGWIRFSMPDGNPTIQIDSDRVKQDTSTIIDKAKQTVDDFKSQIDDNSVDSSQNGASEDSSQ